jgi:hypothetical protein
MRLKIVFPLYPQALKQLPLALKEVLEGGNKQRFAKATGAREEVIFPGFDHLRNLSGFVNIKISSFPELAKILYADGVFFHSSKDRKKQR